MCAGVAVLFGPPTVALGGYLLFETGRESGARWTAAHGSPPTHPPPMGVQGALAAAVGAVASYRAFGVLVKEFDEGGACSFDFKRGSESLGEPLKIKTWTQFYKAAGPPAFARTAAVIGSCFVAGTAASAVAHVGGSRGALR